MIFNKIIGTLCLCIISFASSLAQSNITLKIIDFEKQAPLPGVLVITKNADKKQLVNFSDTDGKVNFSINTPCHLTIHLIGYQDQEFILTGQDTVLQLKPAENILNEIVVTGENQITASDKSVFNTRVLNAAEIEANQAINLAEILNTELNIRLSPDNILGTAINMNGLSGQNIKILIDGVPVIGRENGNIDLSQILLSNVDRIEIVQGPMSSMYGTDAIGGLINIITKQNSKYKTEASINALHETNGRYNLDGNIFIKIGADHFTVNGGRNFFDGYNSTETERWQQWMPYEQHFFSVAYGLKTRFTDFQLKTDYFHQTAQNKGEPVTTPYEAYAFDEYYLTDRWNITLLKTVRLNRNLKLDFTNAYSNYTRIRNTYRKDLVSLSKDLIPLSSMQDTSMFNSFSFRGNISKILASNSFSYMAGYDISIEKGAGQKLLNLEQSIEDYALFGNLQWEFKKIILRPAIRYAYNTRYQAPVIPSFNLVFKANSKWSARMSYSRGFRAPSLKEMDLYFVDVNHNIQGNPDLIAEDSHHILFSTNYSRKISQSTIQLKSSFSYNLVHNIITLALINSTQQIYSYINIDDFKTVVGNIEAGYQFNNFDFSSGFSLTGLHNSLSSKNSEVPQFSYSPEWNSGLSYEWKSLNLKCNIQLKVTGTTFGYALDDSARIYQNKIDSYTMLDAGLSKNIFKQRMTISAGGKNLLNVVNINSTVLGGIHDNKNGTQLNSTGRLAYLKIAFKFYKQ